MPDAFLLDPARADTLRAHGLRGADDLFTLGGDPTRHRFGAVVTVWASGVRGYLKRYHYPGWATARGLVGRGSLWGRAPEINEFQALAWLRANGVPAVRPLAAASRRRRGRLVAHALLTEWVPDSLDLATALRAVDAPLRGDGALLAATLQAIAHALQRMHARGFVHRDCHARNIVMRVEAGGPRIWFLDCRRGGVGGRRPPAYDLATLAQDLQTLLPPGPCLRALRDAYEPDRARRRRLLADVAAIQRTLPAPRR